MMDRPSALDAAKIAINDWLIGHRLSPVSYICTDCEFATKIKWRLMGAGYPPFTDAAAAGEFLLAVSRDPGKHLFPGGIP